MSSKDKWKTKLAKPLRPENFVTNQTHFIDRSLNPQHAYTYTVKAMLSDLATQVSEQATVETYSELMDDRDSRIQCRSCLWKLGRLRIIWRNREICWPFKRRLHRRRSHCHHSFHWRWYRNHGLKSSELGLPLLKLMAKRSGAWLPYCWSNWKGSLIGRFSGLSDGPHTLTLRVKTWAQRTW